MFLFDAGPISNVSDTLSFTLTLQGGSVQPGQYFVRVRIDGAESPLDVGSGGAPVGPVVKL
jgi:hypothetical protein